jgi:hypothetical protein
MREVYYDAEFVAQLADLEQHVPRVREFLRGVTFKLRRDPEFGTRVQEYPPVWFVAMPDIIESPLAMSYTFDDEKVILLSIWISE